MRRSDRVMYFKQTIVLIYIIFYLNFLWALEAFSFAAINARKLHVKLSELEQRRTNTFSQCLTRRTCFPPLLT